MITSNRIQCFLSASCNSAPRADYLVKRHSRYFKLSEEDIRIHALLDERLAALERERQSLWSRVVRLLFASRPVP